MFRLSSPPIGVPRSTRRSRAFFRSEAMAFYAGPTDFEMAEDWEDRGKSDRCLSVLMIGPYAKTYEGVRCQLKVGHKGDHRHEGKDSWAGREQRVSCEIVWRAMPQEK
jgi:hypothetical protein